MFSPALVRPLSALLLVVSASSLSAQDYDWGRKMFDRTEVRFGSVAKNGDVVFKFNVKNIYKEDILITSLSTSCGCISWQERDRTPIRLASGQTQELSIRLDTVRHQGDKNVTAFVQLSEPTRGSTASISIPVQGRIRTDVVLQTNLLNFGQVDLGQAMEHRLNVSYTGGRPDWAITQAKVNSPYLTTKVLEKGRAGGTANYEVVVTLKGDTPVSKLRDQMLLVTNDVGDSGYAVAVEAQVEPDIVVADVQFGQVASGQSKTMNIVVRGKKPFKIEKIDRANQDDNFKVKAPESVSTVHMLPMTFTPTGEHGLFEEEFFLTISGREQRVTFKAKGRVMDQSVTVAKPVTQP
ncbi:DUF1573 domain-containing protein [Schlesneria paludicola]|uniref:DUF1573 domain-containing protein n=1 Tax=Schlesneria paludicola TaxID=360056 RepID=UPI00029A53A0|nr:DUF1573 domain-containing protein [Schlesneria paludicola]